MILGFCAVGFMTAALAWTTREAFREHDFNHHYRTTPREDS